MKRPGHPASSHHPEITPKAEERETLASSSSAESRASKCGSNAACTGKCPAITSINPDQVI